MMLASPSVGSLHSFEQVKQNKVQHDCFHYGTPLALASHDTDGIVNGTITFPRSRSLKLGAT